MSSKYPVIFRLQAKVKLLLYLIKYHTTHLNLALDPGKLLASHPSKQPTVLNGYEARRAPELLLKLWRREKPLGPHLE
jgi:hypothetical protein